MPKFLVEATYTAEGLRGLIKEGAASRKAAVTQAVKKLGGKAEGIYWCLGDKDAVMVVDMPDAASAAAVSLAVSASGLVRAKTTVLLTAEETDEVLAKQVTYRAPGA